MCFSSSLLIIRRSKVGDTILYYDEAILQRKNSYRYKKPCNLEISYVLGCMKIHYSCIVKYNACDGGTLPNVWVVAS